MTKEELEDLILVQKLSYEEIGRREGISGSGVKKRARKFGITLPERREINPSEWAKFGHAKYTSMITCPVCGKQFRQKYATNIYCSRECCGVHLKNTYKRTKEKPVWDGIEKKNMWTYNQVVDNNGYLYAMCPQHPKALKNGYIYLHRLIVENYLGRLLKDDEVIHHKDLNKKNNSLDNLLVLSPSEHSKLHWQLRRQTT
jgi:ribosomal protein L37AE/L43A